MLTTSPSRRSRAQWLRHDLARAARRYRRWVGAALLAVAVLAALSAVSPQPAPTVEVAVAARDLAAGRVLEPRDVAAVRLPAGVVPSTARPTREAVGQTLARPLAQGELATTSTWNNRLLAATEPGTLALPVRVTDPAAARLVAAGDRVDVLAARPGAEGSVVAAVGTDLIVLRAPAAEVADEAAWTATGGSGGSGATGGAGDDLVVVAATAAEAREIVAGSADGGLWIAIRSQP